MCASFYKGCQTTAKVEFPEELIAARRSIVGFTQFIAKLAVCSAKLLRRQRKYRVRCGMRVKTNEFGNFATARPHVVVESISGNKPDARRKRKKVGTTQSSVGMFVDKYLEKSNEPVVQHTLLKLPMLPRSPWPV